MKPTHHGYTLYEMLAVLAIIAIILVSALPLVSYSLLKRTNEMVGQQLKAVLNLALNEALRTGNTLTICGASYNTNSLNQGTYLHGCATTNSWAGGVLAYQDADGDGVYRSGERVISLRFDDSVKVCISHTSFPSSASCANGSFAEPLIALTVNPDSSLSEGTFNKWYLTITEQRFGWEVYSQLTINSYGNVCVYRDNDGDLNSGC
jgi:prepilin-type N-terminal cleavage/methylation domain-containing protein